MIPTEQSRRGSSDLEVAAAEAAAPESTGSPPSTGADSPALTGERDLAGLIIELTQRMDAMSEWASKTQAKVRALGETQQTLEGRLNITDTLQGAVENLMDRVNDLHSDQPRPLIDGAIGYQPTPQQQGQLFAALAEWQCCATTVGKGQIAKIKTRSGDEVSYSYADIGAVSEIARGAGKHGLSHFHREIVLTGQSFIRTYLTHSGGGWISCDVPLLVKENSLISSMQQWASACTMARRYGLFLVLGIAVGEEDDDGAGAGVVARSRNSSAPAAATQGGATRPATTYRTTAPR